MSWNHLQRSWYKCWNISGHILLMSTRRMSRIAVDLFLVNEPSWLHLCCLVLTLLATAQDVPGSISGSTVEVFLSTELFQCMCRLGISMFQGLCSCSALSCLRKWSLLPRSESYSQFSPYTYMLYIETLCKTWP